MTLENKFGLTSSADLAVKKNSSARKELWNFLKIEF